MIGGRFALWGAIPSFEGANQYKRLGVFLRPKAFFSERVYHSLGVCVAYGSKPLAKAY